MKVFKELEHQERTARAAAAKEKLLEKMKARPPVDPAVLAQRAEAQRNRDAAEAVKREERRLAKEQAAAEKAERKAQEAAAAAALIKPPKTEKTEAERKAIRDARYAARKGLKR